MNYLAHLLLSESSSDDSLLGNFLGDFIKGSLDKYQNYYNSTIIHGIYNHRCVDVFTDQHPLFRQSRQRLDPNYQRLAGIFIDVYYDHFLSIHWSDFSQESLESFIAKFYLILETNQLILPDKLQRVVPRIIQENWLASYQHIQGVNFTISRILQRILNRKNSLLAKNILKFTDNSHQNFLELANRDFLANYQGLENDFNQFFPQLQEYIGSKYSSLKA